MREIVTVTGDKYLVDEASGVVYKNGVQLSSSLFELVYSNFGEGETPQFAGIHLIDKNAIVTASGKINPVSDINSLQLDMAKHFTIGELMAIDSVRQEKAGKSSVTLRRTYHELRKDTLFDKFRSFFSGKAPVKRYNVIFKFDVVSDTGNKHVVYIRLDPDFNLGNMNINRADIYCDCADFKYRSAYILNKRDSLFTNNKISSALGSAVNDAPKKVSTTVLCKHAFAALSWLVNNYTNVMKTI